MSNSNSLFIRNCFCVLYAMVITGCAVNPVTGDRELALISESQEIALGRQSAEQIGSSLGLVDNQGLQSYVSRIGMAMAVNSERPDLPWQFQVVDDPVPNAFALPGGYIFVTRGLLSIMNSEAELAAVLGHEIGHVTARHSVNQMSRAQLAQVGLGLGMVLMPEMRQFGDLASNGLGLLFLKHGRDDERQADDLGFRYMLSERYDPREMADVFSALQASSVLAGRSETPSWLASHPSEASRISAVRNRVQQAQRSFEGLTVNSREFFNQIDGMVYGKDPRQGFFEGNAFYHPELRIQFRVPADWQRNNTASAVNAASPQGDAAMRLTLAPADMRAAAQEFFAAQEVSEIETRSLNLGGYNALVSRFAVQGQPGQSQNVQGVVAHIGQNDSLGYRLLMYSVASTASSYDRVFEDIISSFSRVTDPNILSRQAARINTVRIDQNMTLREFANRYPSSIPLGELAVVNQVGPDSRLTAGSLVKQVAP